MKKLIPFLFLPLLFLTSCKHKVDFTKDIQVITKYEGDLNDLWLFTLDYYLVGVDLETCETKLVVKLPVGVEHPIVYNNKVYLGEHRIFGWEHNRDGVLILDSNMEFVKEITTVPNITRMSVYKDYLFTNCFAWNEEGNSAFAVIDLRTDELALEYEYLTNDVTNAKQTCWGYNDKVYLGLDYYPDFTKPYLVTIVNTNPLEVIETTDVYTNDFPTHEFIRTVVNDNQLWVIFRYKDYITVYDLDTNEKIASIDLRKVFPEVENEPFEHILNEQGFCEEYNYMEISHPRIIDGMFYAKISNHYVNNEPRFNAFFGIDTSTFEVTKKYRVNNPVETYRLPINFIEEYQFSKADPDIIFCRDFNHIYEFSISQEKFIADHIVYEE